MAFKFCESKRPGEIRRNHFPYGRILSRNSLHTKAHMKYCHCREVLFIQNSHLPALWHIRDHILLIVVSESICFFSIHMPSMQTGMTILSWSTVFPLPCLTVLTAVEEPTLLLHFKTFFFKDTSIRFKTVVLEKENYSKLNPFHVEDHSAVICSLHPYPLFQSQPNYWDKSQAWRTACSAPGWFSPQRPSYHFFGAVPLSLPQPTDAQPFRDMQCCWLLFR